MSGSSTLCSAEVGLLLEERLRNEQREVRVAVPGVFEHPVQRRLHQLPDRGEHEFNDVFGGGDSSHANDGDLYGVGSVVDHADGDGLDGRS